MKKIFFTLSSILLLVSCGHEENSFNLPINDSQSNSDGVISFADYYDFITANTKDKVLISTLSFINSTGSLNNISAGRSNSTSPYLVSLDGSQFTPNYIYNSSTGSSYQFENPQLLNFFGKKLNLEFTSTELLLTDDTNFDVYIPNVLTASISNLENGKIQAGTTITWNADEQNTNGVVLSAEYNPLTQSSEEISTEYPHRITGGITFEDTGSYTIQTEDLVMFPNGSTISFSIGRAGYIITNNGNVNDDLSFGAYTMVKGIYEINY